MSEHYSEWPLLTVNVHTVVDEMVSIKICMNNIVVKDKEKWTNWTEMKISASTRMLKMLLFTLLRNKYMHKEFTWDIKNSNSRKTCNRINSIVNIMIDNFL